MSKKLISLLVVVLTLSVFTMGCVFAATAPTPVVKINGTTLSTNTTYTIDEGQTISLSANGASKVAYKVATETTKIINGSSTTFTIPTSYTGTGEFSLYVCAINSNGVQGQWYAYQLSVAEDSNTDMGYVNVPVVKVNNTTLRADTTYTISEGQNINVSANGMSKIIYKIGTETAKQVTGSSVNFTIPTSYTNQGGFTLSVCSVNANGLQSSWYTYELAVVKDTTSDTIKPVVQISGKTLYSDTVYTINEGQVINIIANGASKIGYKIANQSTEIVTGSSVGFTIPTVYTGTGELTLYVCSINSDGIQSQWYPYYINVASGSSSTLVPTVNVKVSNATLSPDYTYTIEQGQVIQITTTNATKVYYKIANESMVTVNSSSVALTIPTRYTDQGTIAFSVCSQSSDGTQSGWKTYYLDVTKDANTVDSTIIVKTNGKTLNTDTVYTIDEGQEINIQVPNANRIYYKFGNSYTESIVGTNGTVTVPEKYTNAGMVTLSVSAILYDGTQTNWKVYYFEVDDSSYVNPNITVKVGKTTLNNSITYVLEEGQEIDIYANNARKIVYKIGNSSEVTVNSLSTTITIPTKYTNTGLFELKVATISANGERSSWKIYNLEIREGINNEKYPFIILSDEKLNGNLSGLNISLRTVPLTTKTGNMNYFLLNENIQFNIDFVNASKTLTDEVTIDFVIPDGFEVKFVDTKGAKKVNDNTLRWTFDGMEKGEKGTIPITLYYTAYPSRQNVAKPYAIIKSTGLRDTSAVINMIAKNASTEVSTKHEPFMYGDAGTNTFRPSEGMNRAEVAIMLTRILDLRLVSNYEVTYKDAEDFEDPQYAWATRAIMTVTKYGLMEGYDDGTFRPGAKVTKAQLITILARAFDMEDEDIKNEAFVIKDEPIKLFNNLSVVYSSYGYSEHWAAKYLAQMIRLNILPEFANTIDGNLDLIITRGEAAKLFCTVLYRGPAVDITNRESLTNEFKDVSERTSNYEYILEATADEHNSIYQKNGWEKITD